MLLARTGAADYSFRIPRARKIPLLPSNMLLTLLEQHKRKRRGEAEDLTHQSRLNCRAGSEEKNNISPAKQIWSGISEELPEANLTFSTLLLGNLRRSFRNWVSSPARAWLLQRSCLIFFPFILYFFFGTVSSVDLWTPPQHLLLPSGFCWVFFLAETNIRVQILARALFSL